MPAKKQESPKPSVQEVLNPTVDQLIAEHNQVDDWLKSETKRFAEHCKPYKDRLEAIGNQLLALSNQQKWDNIKTDAGTAYRSTLLNVSISEEGAPYMRDGREQKGRDALLDFALDNWEAIGNDLLLVSAQKDAVKRYLEEHGAPPPGIKTSWFTRINVRRT